MATQYQQDLARTINALFTATQPSEREGLQARLALYGKPVAFETRP